MQITINKEDGRTQIVLSEVAWAVHDIPDGEPGAKMLVFGDNQTDVLIPLDKTPSMKMSVQLAAAPAKKLVKAGVTDISALRKDAHNGS